MQEKIYQCPFCGTVYGTGFKQFPTQAELITHYESKHPTLKGSVFMVPDEPEIKYIQQEAI